MKILYFIPLVFLFACGSNQNSNFDWEIPPSEVFDGGVGKDGIPSVDSPRFNEPGSQNLGDSELVVGILEDGVAKAYPHEILDWHEIVNDNVGESMFAITYCPLTGTAVGWDRQIGERTTTFGVSGKLYNTNLMPYDRETDSYWSQLRLDCVNGELIGTKINTIPIVETSWETWRASYPNTLLMNRNTGINRNYDVYPYDDYITNNDRIFFPVNNIDNRLPAKERVLTVITAGGSRAYSINVFDEFKVLEDQVGTRSLFVAGSKSQNFMVAYDASGLTGFTPVVDALPVIAEDNSGNQITLTGDIVSGPRQGQKLEPVEAIIGYYFAMAAFYPEIEIYQ